MNDPALSSFLVREKIEQFKGFGGVRKLEKFVEFFIVLSAFCKSCPKSGFCSNYLCLLHKLWKTKKSAEMRAISTNMKQGKLTISFILSTLSCEIIRLYCFQMMLVRLCYF